ncbi:hypothetical protein HYALB_00008381 [Hymenoscyphus albidus]|uniref:Uncharacterized protein n=1 Tax=Hymenoscyphus albidus TaxID=595503 RepID=A0A9N9LSG6_9HELO|nr:hypothetical protein HYALB_00008381 [Hymenoscyphus albidus]
MLCHLVRGKCPTASESQQEESEVYKTQAATSSAPFISLEDFSSLFTNSIDIMGNSHSSPASASHETAQNTNHHVASHASHMSQTETAEPCTITFLECNLRHTVVFELCCSKQEGRYRFMREKGYVRKLTRCPQCEGPLEFKNRLVWDLAVGKPTATTEKP